MVRVDGGVTFGTAAAANTATATAAAGAAAVPMSIDSPAEVGPARFRL